MIDDDTARDIAIRYNNDQWSPTFAFACNGAIDDKEDLLADLLYGMGTTDGSKIPSEVRELADYIEHHGQRPPVSGWPTPWDHPSQR